MDAANMFFSVESRAPFLDNRIIDYTSKLSIEQLMPNGIDKEILKNIGAKYLPREFFDLPKKGFSIPYVKYMKNQWGNLLEDFIKEGISSDLGLINSDEVLNYLAVFRKNESNKLGKIMYGLFVFEIWLRVFHLKRNPEEIKLY
jgi:asparagine synthase (glutamine-hydrolysing)